MTGYSYQFGVVSSCWISKLFFQKDGMTFTLAAPYTIAMRRYCAAPRSRRVKFCVEYYDRLKDLSYQLNGCT